MILYYFLILDLKHVIRKKFTRQRRREKHT